MPRSHRLQHLGHHPTVLQGPGLTPQPGDLLHHAPIGLENIVDLEHLFPCDGGVTAAAPASIAE